jgi:hypothetical protein
VDEEFVKARTQLVKERAWRDRKSQYHFTLSWWVEEPELPQDLCYYIGHSITADFHPRHNLLNFQEVNGPDTGENLASVVYTALSEL